MESLDQLALRSRFFQNIEINSFGEIQMSYDIDKLNSFLNEKVDDKKLRHLGKEGEETEEETETES